MKAVVQRVLSASVTVEKTVVSSISKGLLVFAAVAPEDDEKDVASMAKKILSMRFWDGDDGARWKKSVVDINGEVLCVSQFTLLASTKKGNKPDFHGAMAPDKAKQLYDLLLQRITEGYQAERVKDGVFQAMMEVALVNDGPVTLELMTTPKQPNKKNPTTTKVDAGTGSSSPKPPKPLKQTKEGKEGGNKEVPLDAAQSAIDIVTSTK